jgi:hypothetical protein
MPSIGFEVARRRVWGAVKHGAMRVWHFGPVSFWWTAGRVSDELAANERTLRRASEALRKATLTAVRVRLSDQ